MDANTLQLLGATNDLTLEQNIKNINEIYNSFKAHENDLTIPLVQAIFNKIDETYYGNIFQSAYLPSGPKVTRPALNFKNITNPCKKVDAFLELAAYDDKDPEYTHFDYGFHIALDCLISTRAKKVYYSGGYITQSKIMFIILMLLHESIHIIEFKDPYLASATTDHTVFFYKYAYNRFKLISRMSEMLPNTGRLSIDDKERLENIQALNGDLLANGADAINDHSSYMNERNRPVPLTYIVHNIFSTNFIENTVLNGGKPTRRLKKRKPAQKNRKTMKIEIVKRII